MAKHHIPSFEDTDEGRVCAAMKQGVFNAVAAIIQERFGSEDDLKALELYNSAIKALNEIDKIEDSLTEGDDSDQDTE